MNQCKFKHLFSPLRVNGMMLKNRILCAPMGIIPGHKIISSTNYGGMSAFDRSLGGSALVHICGEYLDLFEKYQLDVTREQLSVAKQGGAKVAVELGFFSVSKAGEDVIGPMDGTRFDGFKMHAATKQDMLSIIDDLVKECVQCRDFGFDAVTLHFGHDSLCSQFLSPFWNDRKDEYGGENIENRIRFAKEAILAVRQHVGTDFPLILRVSRNLKVPETYPEDDMLYFIKSIEHLVDMVNISCGMDVYHKANVFAVPTIFEPHMYNAIFAKKVKDTCDVLVCLVGAVMNPQEGEQLLQEGACDAIMSGRSLIADPYWPKKAQEGQEEDIVPCLRCMQCYHIASNHMQVECSVNPRFRRENRYPLLPEKAAVGKKVIIIGGGPGGMMAAITAAKRGHQVVLLEAEDSLGGALNVAEIGMFKEDLSAFKNYLITQVKKLPIKAYTNFIATKEVVENLHPEYVILALGASPVTCNIEGAKYAMQGNEAILNMAKLKDRIVIIGGGTIGCELALKLSLMNKKVSIIEQQDGVAKQGNMLYRTALLQHLESAENLELYTEATCCEIKEDEVIIKQKDGTMKGIPCDNVILSLGMKARKEEAFDFYGICQDTVMIGDCNHAGKVLEAVNEAYAIACSI